MHCDGVLVTGTIIKYWEDFLGLWIFRNFESLIVKNHWNRCAVNVLRSPSELHIWLHA